MVVGLKMVNGTALGACDTGFGEIDAGAALGCDGGRANGDVVERGPCKVVVESAGGGVAIAGKNCCAVTAVVSP